jgi:hypothetical protein
MVCQAIKKASEVFSGLGCHYSTFCLLSPPQPSLILSAHYMAANQTDQDNTLFLVISNSSSLQTAFYSKAEEPIHLVPHLLCFEREHFVSKLAGETH